MKINFKKAFNKNNTNLKRNIRFSFLKQISIFKCAFKKNTKDLYIFSFFSKYLTSISKKRKIRTFIKLSINKKRKPEKLEIKTKQNCSNRHARVAHYFRAMYFVQARQIVATNGSLMWNKVHKQQWRSKIIRDNNQSRLMVYWELGH